MQAGYPVGLVLGPVAAAMAVISGLANVAMIEKQQFARGGVVEGNSYYGDRVDVRANSGEMILTQRQQRRLLDIADAGGEGSTPLIFQFYNSDGTAETLRREIRNGQADSLLSALAERMR
jgi:hypothetical protein